LEFFVEQNQTIPYWNLDSSQFWSEFTGFQYTLDGTPMTFANLAVSFRNNSTGTLTVCFDLRACINGLEFLGPQLYSGPESTPMLNPGTYTMTGLNALSNASVWTQHSFSAVTIAPVPEPRLAWLGVALLCFGFVFSRRSRAALFR
jgi:hypothetical protein